MPTLTDEQCRALYLMTVVNPILSFAANEYSSLFPVLYGNLYERDAPSRMVPNVYRTLFYFARLKPRLLFVVGACLRALQQTTGIQSYFDPSAGVGAGLNLLALCTHSRWPSELTLGWAASKPMWHTLKAKPPPENPGMPISVNLAPLFRR
jgi:hypothetical protein